MDKQRKRTMKLQECANNLGANNWLKKKGWRA